MIAPEVTIGLAVYNGERVVRRAIDSLLAQDYPALTLVISDNASTDGTRAIAEDYARRDPRVRLDFNLVNIGAVPNFQKLAAGARTPYFMWAAADDLWRPTYVSRMVAELEAHPDAGVAFCAVDLVGEDGAVSSTLGFDGVNELSPWETVQGLLSPAKYNVWVYGVFRTELLREAAARCPVMPAWDRWLMLLVAFGARFRYVDEVHHVRTVYTRARPRLILDGLPRELAATPAIARMLWGASFIPPERKAWIPLVLGQYLAGRVGTQLRRIARRKPW